MENQYKSVRHNFLLFSLLKPASFRSLHPTKYFRDYLSQNIRPDGRDFQKFRPIIINVSSIGTADGSAITKVGKSTVICGIKAVGYRSFL